MKLKYKKIILVVTMSTMGIGMIMLSVGGKTDKKKQDKPATTVVREIQETADGNLATDDTKIKSPVTLIGTAGDGVLRLDAYPAINDLVKNYMTAKTSCDFNTLKSLVNDTTMINEEDLRAKSEYIEGCENIASYTLNGPTENTFVVYVYEDLKILNVNTLAPGMTRLFIKLDESGNPYIYLGAIDDDTQKFIEATAENKAVGEVIEACNTKLEEAITKDPDLKKFVEDRSGTGTTDDKKDEDSKDKKSSSDKKEKETKDKSTKSSSSSKKKSTEKNK